MDVPEPRERPIRSALGLLVMTSLGMASLGVGCFLAPSPDDAWSAAYGQNGGADAATTAETGPGASVDGGDSAVTVADASGTTGSGQCAGQPTMCAACCDSKLGPSNGHDFYVRVFHCACPAKLCLACGADCDVDPDPNETCVACLADNANTSCVKAALMGCPSGTSCNAYAACIDGCEP